MNHQYAEEHDIADRYITGKLSGEEEELFEHHLMDCPACVERVEEFEGMRAGLRGIRVRPAARAAWRQWQVAAIAASVGLAVAGGPGLFLWRQLAEAEGRLDAAHRELEAVRRPAPSGVMAGSLYRFDAVRGEASTYEIFVGPQPESIVISMAQEADPAFRSFRVAVIEGGGVEVAGTGDLRPDARNRLTIVIPSTALRVGQYRLRVDGIPEGGQPRAVANYGFRVAARGNGQSAPPPRRPLC